MSTVDKTWVFAADNESLADVGDSAISVAHDAAGNPGGSLEFLGGATGIIERARKAATGDTWETWGVPSSSTVTDVQVISVDLRKWGGVPTTTIVARVVGSGGTTVHTAGDLLSAVPTTSSWISFGPGTSRAVDGGSQASTTDVRIEVEIDLSSASNGVDVGVDNLLLRMTYTSGGGGGTVVKRLSALGVG